jgi:hypothetical protein
VEGLLTLAVVVLLLAAAVLGGGLLGRRRDRRLRAALAEVHPAATVVTGGLTAEGASTLDSLGHRVGLGRSLGGGMVAVAAAPEHVELWWWNRGRGEPLTTLPWDDVRFAYAKVPQAMNRVSALAITPASAPGPRISLQPFRGWNFLPSRSAVERAVATLDAARPAASPPPPSV